MKKIMMSALALLMSAGAFAQKGEMSISLTGNYFRQDHVRYILWGGGSKNRGHFGSGLQFTYGITNGLRVAPGFNYFFEREGLTAYEANLNFHYLIPILPGLKVYPIAGASVLHEEWKNISAGPGPEPLTYNNNATPMAANLGAGVQFDFCRRWFVNADYIYKTNEIERSQLSLGVGVKF
jgi:outer membrane protein X